MEEVIKKLDSCSTICVDYFYKIERKIKSCIDSLEELVEDDNKFEEFIDVVDKLKLYNDEMWKEFKDKYIELFKDIAKNVDEHAVHAGDLMFQIPKYFNKGQEEKYLKEQTDLEIKMVNDVHSFFQDIVRYVNSLEKEYKKRLNKYWMNKIKDDTKEIIKIMNEFYNNEFNDIKVINEEITKKLESSKR